jgi:hypothetical protein
MKAVYGKTIRTVWAADGGQPSLAPPPTQQSNAEGNASDMAKDRTDVKDNSGADSIG